MDKKAKMIIETQSVADFFKIIPPELATMVIAMTPIFELRGSLPIALTIYDMSIPSAFFWSVVGNILPAVLIVFFLDRVADWLSARSSIFERFFNWLYARTRRKAREKIEKYGPWGLFILVAIPLPVTGGWTGALAAFLFGIEKKKAIPIISLGIVAAGIIVTLITIGAIQL